ncbi:hypothetical protein GDO81_022374 [Engystomops pustulosus]|uniref:Uncharacterized protein n=1 Tax=Engystomops pustulosus TaxID=76066 RepID=A0AAV6YMC6_ENGPU|nr:hypothetical protein GDO81_022374 [Engystomops pustulosus]
MEIPITISGDLKSAYPRRNGTNLHRSQYGGVSTGIATELAKPRRRATHSKITAETRPKTTTTKYVNAETPTRRKITQIGET